MKHIGAIHSRVPSWLITILTIVLGYAFFVGIHSVRLPTYNQSQNFFWNGEHLITNVDGYYYLRMAREVAAGTYASEDPLRYSIRPDTPPLISSITAQIDTLFNTGIMDTAFFLPVLLAGLGVLLYFGFGRYLHSYSLGFLAALFCAASHIWFVRTQLGWFDTDCLNPIVLWAVILFLALFIQSTHRNTKFIWLTCTLLATLVFYAWWPTGAPLLCIPLLAYVVSALMPGQPRIGRLLIFFSAPVAAVIGFMAVSGVIPTFLPFQAIHILSSLHAHIILAFKGDPGLFPEVGSVIAELGIFPVADFIKELTGHWGVFVLAVTGIIHMSIKRNETIIFIALPAVIFSLLSFTAGNRFIIFTTPAMAVGLAWFCRFIVYEQLRKVTPAFGFAYTATISIILLIPGLNFTLSEPLEPVIDANMAQLFTEAGNRTSPDTLLWGPWGPGYAVQYFANRRTLVDGGFQTPELVYITESPLASKDTAFSRNWIRFFSKHPKGIKWTSKKLKTDKLNALIFLKQALKSKEIALQQLHVEGQTEADEEWLEFLYPEDVETALVFTSSMLFRTVWVSKGLWDPVTDTMPETPLYGYPYEDLQLDRKNGFFIYGKKRIPYSKIMFVTADSLSHDVKRRDGPVAILIKGNKLGFMIQKEYFENLGFRLLFVFPDRTKDFRPLIYHPFVGGVWQVD